MFYLPAYNFTPVPLFTATHLSKNKLGVPVKTVTNPDFKVVNPDSGAFALVEVTAGNNDHSHHKLAQLRVAKRAKVSNYVQISGDQVLQLAREPDHERQLFLLFVFLGW